MGVQSVWSTAEYMDKLTRIPNLLALVTNPFLLNITLRSLPVAFKDDLDPSTIANMTRPKLYKIFINEWLEVNKHRRLYMNHNETTTTKLNELIEAGFNHIAKGFLQNLAKAIYKEQAGNSVVRYVHRDDKETWKAEFFGPDEEITLLRQSSPLTCVENLHSFIHRSLLEYFRSLQMAKLVPTINKRGNEQVETRLRSMSQTNNQQTDLLQVFSTTNDQRKQNNPPSPSSTSSPHQNTQHIMAFNISNALDPESSFTTTNFLANTLRDACADTTLDAKSDGSVFNDDVFEDAQEYLSDDSLKCILEHVQKDVIIDKRVKVDVDVSVESAVEVEKKEAKEVIITKETGVGVKIDVPKGISWSRKLATATSAAVVGAGAAVVGAGALTVGAAKDAASGARHAAHGALEKVDGLWKRTVQVLTTRKAHVDSVAPITKTSYVYYDDEVYDAVLTEKLTGVTHVTQLLFDSATTKYYIYYRWGETDYKLDRPHDTVASAKAAFQITYRENFGVQWKERETTVSERFTYEVKAYEIFKAVEEVEEIVEETKAVDIIAREQEIGTTDDFITTETTTTTTTATEGETVLEHVQKDVIVDKKVEVVDGEEITKSAGVIHTTQLLSDGATSVYYAYYRRRETDYKLDGPHDAVKSAKAAFQITSSHNDTIARNVSEQDLFKMGIEVNAAELSRTQYETLSRVDSTASAAGTDALFGGAAAILGGAAAAGTIHHGGASSITVVEKTKKAVFDFSSLPVLSEQGIDVESGASIDVIDLTSGTAETYRELPGHLRPRAWQDTPHELEGFMRLDDQSGQRLMEIARNSAYGKAQEVTPIDNHCLPKTVALFAKKLYEHFEHFGEELPVELSVERLCELGDDEAKGEVMDKVEAAPSLSFPKYEISGIPGSLGDLATTSLVFEMRDSPIFDDESLGAMDLEEEQDILQFLIEQVHEDTDYTKLLLWTVYKSLTEGIINQSTKNAACILEKARIQFQPQL
ncbi:hypothetical protein BG015_010228 [Linnemannia schmuckeri]|uniref:Uncharacterized protein n=1 Tax=Linnemannia schmuckeri TaxID=64567 RepID=A0A9P5RWG0_9FUNG|nr:hypothetical protein BG015_010228 [Linnemannia schmuckeri]